MEIKRPSWLTPIRAAAGAVVLTAAVGGAFGYDDLRFWASAAELQDIAGVSLKTAIAQRYDFLLLERRELKACEQAGGDCTSIRRRIHDLEQEIKELGAKQQKYGG